MRAGRALVTWRNGQEQSLRLSLAVRRTTAFRGGVGDGAAGRAMILDQQRRLAKQNQRLETLVLDLQREIRKLRDELQQTNRKPTGADAPAATEKKQP